MLVALASAMPEVIERVSTALRDAAPVVLIIIGAILFLFAGAVKWLAKIVGAGLFIYGVIAALQLI